MARTAASAQFLFEGFENPNTTPVPDVVFDRFLSRLGEAELKALLYIIRRTFGFKRDRDPISFNQFLRGITTKDGRVLDEGCGIKDRTSLSKALKSLEEKGIVQSEKGVDERGENATTVYRLRFKESHRGVVGNSYHGGVVGIPYHRGMNSPPPVVGNSYPQETGLQETAQQDTASNRIDGGTRRRSQQAQEPATPAHGEGEKGLRGSSSFAPIAQTLTTRRRAAPPKDPPGDDRAVLAAVLSPYRHEFRDNATERASTTRLLNLYRRSRLERTVFISLLAEAAARTRENVRLGAIEGPAFAYLVSVLEQLLHPDAPGEGNRPAAAPQNALQSIPPSDPLFQATSSSPPGHSPSEGLTAPPEETNPIWKAVLHELQLVLTEANFQTWLATTRVLRQSENTLQVGVPRQFHADWLNHKLRTRITRTMERLGYAGLQVEFVVAGAG